MTAEVDEAGSDDLLAPLPTSSSINPTTLMAPGGGGGAGGGRRLSRAVGGGRPPVARGRLGTLTGPSLGLDVGGGPGHRGGAGGGGVGGLGGFQAAPPLLLENTYRMRPEEAGRFNCRLAREILHAAIESAIAGIGQRYDPARCRGACQTAADQARREMRELDSRRYKLVVSVHAMQLLGQSAVVASRSVGNLETDSYATAQVTAGEFACVGTAHALYYE